MIKEDSEKPFIVLTSIRRPTSQVEAFLRQPSCGTIFVADRRTPGFSPPAGLDLISVHEQEMSGESLAGSLPWSHYARKNLGYLRAIRSGARSIFDTDDDNCPLEPWVARPAVDAPARSPYGTPWVNVYAHFGAAEAWPRGYPLDRIHSISPARTSSCNAGDDVVVWQGLVDGEPDVDAIFRLTRKHPVVFQTEAPIVLAAGAWCPFNSQNTWWDRRAFPYLYLPSTVAFRFTDILRSLIAQRCFWAHGWRLGFHGPTARQERNQHDLMKDFRDELGCYLHTESIVQLLDSLSFSADAAQNLRLCYSALINGHFVAPEELGILECWLKAVIPELHGASKEACCGEGPDPCRDSGQVVQQAPTCVSTYSERS